MNHTIFMAILQESLYWLVSPLILSLQSSLSLASSQDRLKFFEVVDWVAHRVLCAKPHPLTSIASQGVLKQKFLRTGCFLTLDKQRQSTEDYTCAYTWIML